MLGKWKKAVIHIECATDEHPSDLVERRKQEHAALLRSETLPESRFEEKPHRHRDLRFQGTALLLTHRGHRYLLTARHVVWNELHAKRDFEDAVRRTETYSDYERTMSLQFARESAQTKIFNIIFRVPSLDEKRAGRHSPELLMSLASGAPFACSYTFSDPATDLAVISLDHRYSDFANELAELGYEPIASSDIADSPDAEGQEVFTVGFPGAIALVDQISHSPEPPTWSSQYVSLPVTSFGRISMLHDALHFFWADMSIYPGNSGGPVIANDRLVGIVSAQPVIPVEGIPNAGTRIPFAKITKAGAVRALLEHQEQSDRSSPLAKS